ncbi:uncharacterized protein JN550_004323 [Neoarthrinium moseri]|uniref:uncharacterized protein n=1 Tax=Neoarthrinium moseri TaxID=1658444 RepID=UPI001FDDC81C|nr:uncharacterized protein JN550_004323 [Neoarthrinium moseri]KAI1872120.1 hypothetical protein JN550_004323 [Neoarthrinium moseri]
MHRSSKKSSKSFRSPAASGSSSMAAGAPQGTVGRPRLGQYPKLIARFFEPLILLHVLGATRGDHTPIPHNPKSPEFSRRRLLDNLAYLCDFDKGGPTTTALGLEERHDCFKFWIASNRPTTKTLKFMSNAIESLKALFNATPIKREEAIEEFTEACIAFAKTRIIKEAKLLYRAIAVCSDHLSKETDSASLGLVTWLQMFVERDNITLCRWTYGHRNDEEMVQVNKRSRNVHETPAQSRVAADFATLRHRFGRLAHHVRAVNEVIVDASTLQHLFDECQIGQVPTLISVSRPEADAHTTLEGIMNRMLSSTNANMLAKYVESLAEMDQKFEILERASRNNTPVKHSNLVFMQRFKCWNTFTSKVWHTLKEIPTLAVTHRNIYLNWGPPVLHDGTADEGYPTQRDILNAMLKVIRKEVFNQVSSKANALKRHHDSITGLTQSTLSISTRVENSVDVETSFQRLDLGVLNGEPRAVQDNTSQSTPSSGNSFASSINDTPNHPYPFKEQTA